MPTFECRTTTPRSPKSVHAWKHIFNFIFICVFRHFDMSNFRRLLSSGNYGSESVMDSGLDVNYQVMVFIYICDHGHNHLCPTLSLPRYSKGNENQYRWANARKTRFKYAISGNLNNGIKFNNSISS